MPGPTTSSHPPAPAIVRWSVRRPWRALVLWTLAVATAVVAGMLSGVTSLDDADMGSGDSGRAERIIANADYPTKGASEQVLIRRSDGAQLSDADVTRATAALRSYLTSVAAVTDLDRTAARSADGRAALLSWRIAGDPDVAADRVAPMIAAVEQAEAQTPGLTMGEVGDASIERAMDQTIGEDFKRAEILSLPVTLVLLLVVFGALVAAALPLLTALSAIAAAFGLTALVSSLIPQEDAVGSVVLVVGIAVGVDYALFILRRARTERANGLTVRESVLVASATSGRAVLISGLTVMVAMAGMFLAGDPTFTSFGTGCVLVVAVAVLASLTALPASLVLLGDRVDRLRVPFVARRRQAGHGDSRLWGAVVRRSTRRPLLTIAVVGGALVLVSAPLIGMRTQLPYFGDLPRSIPEMQTLDALEAAFPAEGGTHEVAIRAEAGITSPSVRAAIDDLTARVRASNAFAPGWNPELDIAPNGQVARIPVPYLGDANGAKANDSLTLLRETLLPQTVGQVADAHVTGPTAGSRDFSSLVSQRLPIVMAFVVGLTFVLMLLSFRSVWVAAATAGLNLLSVGAAYGLLVIVFQHHWFDGILGLTTNGAIVAWLPLFLFVILFGLSMDYHVFVLSRIREEHMAGASATDAIEIGVRRTASVVTSAAVIMIAAFSIFAMLSTIDMKQLGVGLAAAVAIDATIVRGVLLPATLRLLGDRAWREPAWLQRLPRLGHHERVGVETHSQAVS